MTTEPRWLEMATLRSIHVRVISDHGGSLGVRDLGALDSALAAPRHRFAYGDVDVCSLAAAYSYAITRNHPFVDGNKRVAYMAAYTFLGDNGLELEADPAQAAHVMQGLSTGSLSREEFAEWLRQSSIPVSD